MTALIYQPTKNAMQSGKANTRRWILEFIPEAAKVRDEIMGWVGSGDMKQQVKLKFDTLDAAINYAEKAGIEYRVQKPKAATIKIKAYADNFK